MHGQPLWGILVGKASAQTVQMPESTTARSANNDVSHMLVSARVGFKSDLPFSGRVIDSIYRRLLACYQASAPKIQISSI